MTPQQPWPQQPDPNRTVRHRWPQPPPPQPPEPPGTRRLEYTPDMFPHVQQYEAKPSRSAWWWVILVGGLAVVVAAAAVAVILWSRGGQAEPRKPRSTSSGAAAHGAARVTDPAAHLSYPVPAGWTKAGDGLAQPYTSGLKRDGGIVMAFTQPGAPGAQASIEQLQAQARVVAEQQAHSLLPGTSTVEGVETRALQVGGRAAATASFTLAFQRQDPAYVRAVAVPTGDNTISYVIAALSPDGDVTRRAVDQIMDGVRPA